MSKILNLVKAGKVFELHPGTFGIDSMAKMTKEEMVAIFNYFGAFWKYEGEPCSERPHALLKNSKHSNEFISCKKVLKYPRMCELFANEVLKGQWWKDNIDVVVSPAYSAIGYEVAKEISKTRNQKVEYVPVEKDANGNPTIIRSGINSFKNVLIINELMTTKSGSTWEIKQAVLACKRNGLSPKINDCRASLGRTKIERSGGQKGRGLESECPPGIFARPRFRRFA